ncbi:MAG TPA: MraY family glycosyltransferase [Chloroflexota bacterium]|nr:MraY family glycosyltransferase [Chloroflexota bacterium]
MVGQLPLIPLAVSLVVSCVGVLLLTPVAGALGRRFGLVDQPRPGELQQERTPRSGGYALLTAFLIAIAASVPLVSHTGDELTRILGLIVGIVLVLPIALIDDLRRLGPFPQLVGQIGLASVVMAFGLVITSVANPFGGLIALPVLLAIPFTLLWIVGMINTLNWIDTVDGLAAGVTAIASIVLFARSVSLGQYTISLLPLALAGVCVGFLRYNFNPARIFMGTCGSTFLGFTLAILALIGGAKIATAAFVLGLPIIDTALVIVQRSAQRRSPFVGGDDAHLTHRLVQRGLSSRRIALLIYAVCAAGGMLAMTLNGLEKLWVMIAVGLAAVVLALRFATARPAS